MERQTKVLISFPFPKITGTAELALAFAKRSELELLPFNLIFPRNSISVEEEQFFLTAVFPLRFKKTYSGISSFQNTTSFILLLSVALHLSVIPCTLAVCSLQIILFSVQWSSPLPNFYAKIMSSSWILCFFIIDLFWGHLKQDKTTRVTLGQHLLYRCLKTLPTPPATNHALFLCSVTEETRQVLSLRRENHFHIQVTKQ